jgi:hypothetical protein
MLEEEREYNGRVHNLFIDFEKAYDSVRREALYNVLIEFCMPLKLLRLIKVCLNKSYIEVCIGKTISDAFHVQNGLKRGEALSPLLSNFALEYTIRKI